MPRPKRNSTVLTTSERQLESFQSIDRNLSFGSGLALQDFANLIDQMRQKLATYNTLLSTVDAAQREVELAEEALTTLSKRLATNVVARYGEDSQEYRMIGRKPRSKKRQSTSQNTLDKSEPKKAIETLPSAIQNGATASA
ncbi:hypothetical protein K9N68_33575 [Kovacikia minuta CCNUW1]|uniref:hypothetical protein n=1 Tax=Kovacikia minuta TaxID=2931930 RepID=UPI001CCE9001|nr:hypothetical protein [Kovacikia minuta]UBF26376.1 hypothetical protein K9N68_33575 [Kovacikia minuta CCNUW1]